ncbi:GNAT family N-acetyltransferase [Acetobacterium wieringae]|uniref:GNAT family N-acetyltransferase n=1 Tax=Acetobacterium wieringae TaxID=52694 RepID=UPI00315913D3
MFSRTWHGIVPLKMRAAFEQYEYQTGVKESLAIPGNRGAFLKIVEQEDFAHFFLCTKWDSMASMIAYAGQEPLIAVTYPEDEKYGLISDPIVIIQEVVDDSDPFAAQDDIGGQSKEKSPIQGKNPAITPITYRSGDESLLDDIKELWEALNRHHRDAAVNFKAHYEAFTFAMRKKNLLTKAQNGRLRIEIAVDPKTARNVGYCISRVEISGDAEMESLYVQDDYRGLGLGETLLGNAIAWMDEMGAHTKSVSVAVGNEKAFSFYERFGFYPRKTLLEQIK